MVQERRHRAETRIEGGAARRSRTSPQYRQDTLDVSLIATPSPDFSQALGIRYPNPPSSETPSVIRKGVARLRHIRDRHEKLRDGLRVLHEMLYLAECPDDLLTIAKLIAEVRAELLELEG